MSIEQNIDLNVQNNHINKKYNVLFCYPTDLCYYNNTTHDNICRMYITPETFYAYNTLYSECTINTNHFICYNTLSTEEILNNSVVIVSGIANTSNNTNTSNSISTKRYVDYILNNRVIDIINTLENSFDVDGSYNSTFTQFKCASKDITGFSVDGISGSLTTSTFTKTIGTNNSAGNNIIYINPNL